MLRKSVLKPTLLHSVRTGTLLVAASLGMTLAAQAGDETRSYSSKDSKNVIQQPPPAAPKFYVDLNGAAEFDIHATQFLSNGNTTFTGAGGGPIRARIHSVPFETVHDPVVDARANIGYQVTPYLSLFTGFTYSHSNGHDHRVGYLIDNDNTVLGTPAGSKYDLYARVGDYQAYAGRAGFRINTPRQLLDLLHLPTALVPYFSASAGGKYVESQEVSFYSGTRPTVVDTGYGTLFGNSWVFTTEAELGYELKLTRNASVFFESGYGYDTKLERGSLPGVNGVNRSGDRFYSTVGLGGKIRF